MTFDEVLTQALELLQRQGRVSYSALKRRFDLDDAYLNDLKDELLYVHESEVEADERGFTWTGVTEDRQAPTSQSDQPAPQSVGEQAPTAQEIPVPAEAERRQLTVLFCDLVDSTVLASQLDLEELREVVRAYQEVCAKVVARFEGYIAQYLGDGLLVYFGYPRAHEDDAQRAVWAGLEMIEALSQLNIRLAQEWRVHLAVRLGIHTGLVVVGEMGGGGRQEQLALGETPNIAARLQGLAAPDTIVLSAATQHLIQGYFTCYALGPQTLKGVATPLDVYQVERATEVQQRFDVAAAHGLTPLVGREHEVALLRERWAQVQAGRGHLVVLSGEAGIGKSRLVQVVQDEIIDATALRIACRCSPYHQHSAFYPLIAHLERVLAWRQEDTPEDRFHKLEAALRLSPLPLAEVLPLFAALLSVPLSASYPPLTLTPQRQRQKTLEALLTWLLALTEHQLVLFVVEDLHWIDPSTLEFLTLLVDQGPTARLLTLLTCRPEFQPPWGLRTHLTPMALQRLPHPEVEAMLARITGGKALPPEVVAQIVAKTDGVPLFVEELTKTVLESGLLRERAGHYALTGPVPPLAIPLTLHDSLMARLDRLAPVKAVAQLGAVLGRTFTYELLQAVTALDEESLQQALARLVEAELLYQRGIPPLATYLFKHALIQEAAYQSLLRSTRQQYHQRIAQVLETRFPAVVETQPELVAHHYTAAACHAQAVPYWQRAGERAITRSAYQEAISHLRQALEGLQTQAHTPERSQRELTVLTTLGPVLVATQSYTAPDVEQTYTRAYALCQQMGETSHLFPVLAGLRRIYSLRNEYQKGREMAERLLALAHRVHNAVFLVEAHFALGNNAYWPGEVVDAHAHFEQGIVLYQALPHRPSTPQSAQDPGVACLSYAALTAWLLGYPDQALRRSQEALILAHELAHPHTLAFALCWAGLVHTHRREVQAAHERAEAVLALADEHGFQNWRGNGAIVRGWVLAARGQREEGIAQMSRGEAERQARGSRGSPNAPHYLALIAEAYGAGGQTTEGLAVLAEAQALVDHMGGHYYAAEVARLKGELVLAHGVEQQAEAIACLQHALTIARRQQAKALELRAAMSLARLWQRQGKRTEARALLAPIYGWFTEGFDTADLQDAKALLEALA